MPCPPPLSCWSLNHLLPPEQMPGLPTDLSLHSQGGPEGAPDRCQVQRESQASGDSRELHTKGSRVTGEKQGQMGPASPCQQGSLRSALSRLGPPALVPLARPTLGPNPAVPADAVLSAWDALSASSRLPQSLRQMIAEPVIYVCGHSTPQFVRQFSHSLPPECLRVTSCREYHSSNWTHEVQRGQEIGQGLHSSKAWETEVRFWNLHSPRPVRWPFKEGLVPSKYLSRNRITVNEADQWCSYCSHFSSRMFSC